MSDSELRSGDAGHAPPAVERESAHTRRSDRPRALPTLATILVIALAVSAGNWQRDRLHAKESLRAQLDAAAGSDPIPLAKLADDADWGALRYRPVIASGEFLASRQILIDNKVHAGRVGYDVVTPLVLPDGRAVLVDRGWTPQRALRSELPDVPAPAHVSTVQGRISLPPASYLEFGRAPPAGALWQNLDPARFTAATGLKVLPIVVEATGPTGADDGLVRDWQPPDLGIERHRIYMVQWYALATLAAALWLWFHRPRSASKQHA